MTPKDKMIADIRERCEQLYAAECKELDQRGFVILAGAFDECSRTIESAEAGEPVAIEKLRKAAENNPLSVSRAALILYGDYLISRAQKLPAGDRSLFPFPGENAQ